MMRLFRVAGRGAATPSCAPEPGTPHRWFRLARYRLCLHDSDRYSGRSRQPSRRFQTNPEKGRITRDPFPRFEALGRELTVGAQLPPARGDGASGPFADQPHDEHLQPRRSCRATRGRRQARSRAGTSLGDGLSTNESDRHVHDGADEEQAGLHGRLDPWRR
jgi:hypothetical protein